MRTVWRSFARQYSWAEPFGFAIEEKLAVDQEKLQETIHRELAGRCLVVIIDDLERAAPDVAYEILTRAQAVINVSGLAYLICVDQQTLIGKLRGANLIADEKASFLDKLIDYSVSLPPLAAPAREKLGADFVKRLDASAQLANADLARIEAALPTSPRGIKRSLFFVIAWLRDLGSIPEWLDRGYASGLLLLEFNSQGALRTILQSDELIGDLDHGEISDAVRGSDEIGRILGQTAGEPPSYQKLLQGKGLNLDANVYLTVRHIGNATKNTAAHVAWLLGIRPRREDTLHAAWIARISPTSDIQSLIAQVDAAKPDDIQAGLLAANRVLDEHVGRAADVHTRTQQDDHLACAKVAGQLIDELLNQALVRGISISAAAFGGQLGVMMRWVQFGGPYTAVLQAAWERIRRTAANAGSNAGSYLGVVEEKFESAYEMRPALQQARDALRQMLTGDLTESLLGRFQRKGGIDELRAIKRSDRYPEYKFLFSESFLTADNLSKLKKLAEAITAGDVVWTNLDGLWSITTYAAEKEGDSDAKRLCKNRDWMAFLWNQLTRFPLNRRFVGSLEEDRAWLIRDCSLSEADLPLPDWWAAIKAESEQRWSPGELGQ